MVYTVTYESPNNKAVFNYTMECLLEVPSKNENSTDLKFTFKKITFNGQVDTARFEFDASTPDTSKAEYIYAAPYFASLNHEFLVSYDPKMHKIAEEILTPTDPNSISQPVNRAPFFTVLPNEKVKTGSKWKDKIELKRGEGMVVDAEFEIIKIEKNIVYIHFSGKVGGEGDGYGQEFKLYGTVTGKIEVDQRNGLTLHSEMVQDLTEKLGDQEMPLKIIIQQNIK